MDSYKVKTVFQQAFDRYKVQFDEFIGNEKVKLFSNLFKIKIDSYGNVYIDNIFLGINIKDCGNILSYDVDIDMINIFINDYKTIIIDMEWAYNREVPNIKSIALKTDIYSSCNK